MKNIFIRLLPAIISILITSGSPVPNAVKEPVFKNETVKTGIDVLQEQDFALLSGKRVGLITNQTGVDRHLKSTIDILHEAPNVQLTALFAPEHGIRGDAHAGSKFGDARDAKTGLPIRSLYGKTRKATPQMLEDIDVLVYDIQDIGCRSFTYISTMGLAMQSAAEQHIEFIILDRPNPLGGEKIEGNYVEDSHISFVGQFKIPYIYGQTCGELALMLNSEHMLGQPCKLTVVPMEGWHREMNWEDTGLEWVITSPHIPHKHSPYFYPSTGIFGELGQLSIGVGYTLPFQLMGAPWINAADLADAMNALGLAGIIFRPIHFKPFYATLQGQHCQGVEIHFTDYKKAKLTEIQFHIFQELHRLYPEKATFEQVDKSRFDMFDKVCGSDRIRSMFTRRYSFDDIKDYWYKDIEDYRKKSEKYYLYK
ncbi:MAG: DUF1343 domain-containing protein [Prevotellaceae bacterium]|jgi:uncharacterized protein YbbC (DUF1343 family)|nr:DUF1343 domain-containing protein [Prevotellaceae bacterium]